MPKSSARPLPEDRPLPLPKVMDLLLDAVCVVDETGRYVFVNAAWERLLGYTREEMIGRNMIELVHPEDRERTLKAAANVMRGNPHLHFENRYVRKDGRVVHIMWSARWSETDRMRLAVARDVTELKRAEEVRAALLRISEATYAEDLASLCRQVHEAVGALLPAPSFFVALYDAANATVSFPYFADAQRPAPATQPLVPGTPLAEVIGSGEAVLKAEGEPGGATWLGVPLVSAKGMLGALVVQTSSAGGYGEQDLERLRFLAPGVAAAIARKLAEARLVHLAGHDALTDLPNRVLLDDRLDTALKRARRYEEKLALLYLDLDGFKDINDRHGHEAGDRLLRDTAQRLARCVRASDTVARLGGDEFMVLLTRLHGRADAEQVAAKLGAAVGQPFELEGRKLSISASIGIALHPDDGDAAAELIRRADAAMYAAKQSGRQRNKEEET